MFIEDGYSIEDFQSKFNFSDEAIQYMYESCYGKVFTIDSIFVGEGEMRNEGKWKINFEKKLCYKVMSINKNTKKKTCIT